MSNKKSWISLGLLNTGFDEYEECIGVYKATLDGKVVYIGKATEIENGGFRKRLRDFTRESDSARNYPAGRKMHEHMDKIKIDIMIFPPNNYADIKKCKNEIKEYKIKLIEELQPSWNELDK